MRTFTYLGGIVTAGTLPESESVDHDDIGGSDDGITGTVGELVPAVCSADLDASGKLGLDSLNLALELLASEVSAVKSLGTDSYGVDGIGVLLRDIGDGLEIFVERLFDIRPIVTRISLVHSMLSILHTRFQARL